MIFLNFRSLDFIAVPCTVGVDSAVDVAGSSGVITEPTTAQTEKLAKLEEKATKAARAAKMEELRSKVLLAVHEKPSDQDVRPQEAVNGKSSIRILIRRIKDTSVRFKSFFKYIMCAILFSFSISRSE